MAEQQANSTPVLVVMTNRADQVPLHDLHVVSSNKMFADSRS